MEWSVYKQNGDVLCFCREWSWNIHTCEQECVCPVCGSIYQIYSDGRYTRWIPKWVSPTAKEVNANICLVKVEIRQCIAPEIMRQLMSSSKWEELYELYDLAYSEVYGE